MKRVRSKRMQKKKGKPCCDKAGTSSCEHSPADKENEKDKENERSAANESTAMSESDEPMERTLIIIKPDGVQRKLIGEIIARFERRGYKLVGLKMAMAEKESLEKHYEDLKAKPFFGDLVSYMASAPVVLMAWEGNEVIKQARKMLGETKPLDSLPGTIRGDFSIEVGRNIVHGSDSVKAAKKEISLWFSSEELTVWTATDHKWIYESNEPTEEQ